MEEVKDLRDASLDTAQNLMALAIRLLGADGALVLTLTDTEDGIIYHLMVTDSVNEDKVPEILRECAEQCLTEVPISELPVA